MALTSKITSRGQVTIPEAIRQALKLEEGSILQFELDGGRISAVPLALIPQDQAWFWTKEHQKREREADEDLAKGRYKDFSSADSLMKNLKHVSKHKKA